MGYIMICPTTPKSMVWQGVANHCQKVATPPPPPTGAVGGGEAAQPLRGVVRQTDGWRHIADVPALGRQMSECASRQDRLPSRLLPLTHVSEAKRLRTRATREGINQTTDFFLCMADMRVYANAAFSRMYHPRGYVFFSRPVLRTAWLASLTVTATIIGAMTWAFADQNLQPN